MLPVRDAKLVQIVDAALADATRRSLQPDGSSWLACRPGCTPCCHGVFRISALDAERLRVGLGELRAHDRGRARAIQDRARQAVALLGDSFPGNAGTGALDPEDERWELFADLPEADAPCPALDPTTGRCDLYTARPLTCRLFGPPVLNEGGLGLCELCYIGAPQAAILHGEMFTEHHVLEEALLNELPSHCETVIAWALLP